MATIIILYMLVSHKIGWGVEWYDWCVLSVVLVLNILSGLIEQANKLKNSSSALRDGEESFFSDIVSRKKKDD